MMIPPQQWTTGASLPVSKNVPDIAFQLSQNSLKRVDSDILLGNLKALQRRVGNSRFSGKLGKRQVSTAFPQKLAQPLPELMAHLSRMASRVSHIWDFSLDVLPRPLYLLANPALHHVLPLPKDFVFLLCPIPLPLKNICEQKFASFLLPPQREEDTPEPTPKMKIPALFAAMLVGSSFLHAQELKPVGEAPHAFKILDSQEVEVGDHSIFYNRIEAPNLKPEAVKTAPVAVEPVPMTAEEEAAQKAWEEKFQYSPFLGVTVYDGQFSEVRWWEEGRENVIWSNINFLHFAPFGDLETDTAYYWIMLSGWETTTAEVKTMNASAQSREELMPLPPASLPLLGKSGPQWIAAGPLSENAKQAMKDFHEYYRVHGAEMAVEYQRREEEAKAHEEWVKENPPIPQDTIVNFFPIRSVHAPKTVPVGETTRK